MLEKIELGKKDIRLRMSPQQLAEAEDRAAAWLKDTRKRSAFAGDGEAQAGAQKKMHAGAR